MNQYLFDDLAVGMTESFKTIVDEKMINIFSDLCGDYNPLHTSEEFAMNVGFEGRVVFGLLTSSFFSRLVGMCLPGKYCLLRSIECKYVLPVYLHDELTVKGVITELNSTVQLISMDAYIINSSGKRVVKARIKIGLTNRVDKVK